MYVVMNNPDRIFPCKVEPSRAQSEDDLLGKFLTGNQSQSIRSKTEKKM